MRLALVMLLLALSASTAHAQDCDNASDQATLNQCAGEDLQKADAELNAVYKQIRERLKDDPDTTKLLVGSERAWITFRDAECEFAASSTVGGSIYPMIVANCRTGLTNQRVEQLKAYLTCEEGDLDCPVPAE